MQMPAFTYTPYRREASVYLKYQQMSTQGNAVMPPFSAGSNLLTFLYSYRSLLIVIAIKSNSLVVILWFSILVFSSGFTDTLL